MILCLRHSLERHKGHKLEGHKVIKLYWRHKGAKGKQFCRIKTFGAKVNYEGRLRASIFDNSLPAPSQRIELIRIK